MSEVEKVPTGFIYVVGNQAMPGLYKVGYTTRSVKTRIQELSAGTSVPDAFYGVARLATCFPRKVESDIHRLLLLARRNEKREFFSFESDIEAATIVIKAAIESEHYHPVTRAMSVWVAKEKPYTKPLTKQEQRELARRGRQAICGLRSLLG